MSAAAPAGFWRRYLAWSLDFAGLAALAALLTRSRIMAGWDEAAAASSRLSGRLAGSVDDALLQGGSPAQLAAKLLADPQVQAAADAVQTGIEHMLLPWLLGYAVLAALYHVGCERSRWQGSPGKHALHLVVVDARHDGQPALLQTGVRHVAGALSWLTLNLGHALAAMPPQRRALHDYLAGTRVVCLDDNPRLPAWARAWLVVQAMAGIAVPAWWVARSLARLRQAGLP